MDGKRVLKKIKEIIDRGEKEFVIYPFGNNGVLVKNLLMDYFGLEPKVIVDNGYAGYRKDIIDFREFSNIYVENMFVIFTIEDEEANANLYRELLQIVPKNKVLNLMEEVFLHRNRDVGDRYLLRSFLPESETFEPIANKKIIDNSVIRVRIVYNAFCEWNTIRTIIEECIEDDEIELQIILARVDGKRIKQLENLGYDYILSEEYDVSIDQPDVLVFSHAYPLPEFNNCRRYAKLIVIASLGVIRYSHSNEEYCKTLESGFGIFKPDCYIFDSLVYQHMKDEQYFIGKNIVEMGNAKYDGIYNACIEMQHPEEWNKLKGKPVILWTTDHGVIQRKTYVEAYEGTTFDLYAKYIFQYAKEHEDIGFIFRPHPSFIGELLQYNYWSVKDMDKLRNYCKATPNLVWDERDTYDAAYAVADAILTDSQCGIVCSALPTMRPICVLYRSGENIVSYEEELVENYYSAGSEAELAEFFGMIVEGKDPMKERRKMAFDKYVKSFDGKNGYRLKEFLKTEFRKKYTYESNDKE